MLERRSSTNHASLTAIILPAFFAVHIAHDEIGP